MEVKFRASFEKDVESIDDKKVLDAIFNTIHDAEIASKPQDIRGIKK